MDQLFHEILVGETPKSNSTATEFELVDNSVEATDHVCFISYPSNCTKNNIELNLNYLSSFQALDIPKSKFSIALTVLYIPGDNVFPVVQKVLELQNMGISVLLRMRHLKAEPVLQIYEASFSFCPQNSLFFTSRVNVVPKIQKELLNEMIRDKKKRMAIADRNIKVLATMIENKPHQTFG